MFPLFGYVYIFSAINLFYTHKRRRQWRAQNNSSCLNYKLQNSITVQRLNPLHIVKHSFPCKPVKFVIVILLQQSAL